jgi:hypothetical protein
MNGRLYDPKLHRFLQPDNFIQDPYNTQNYNRYGYAFNNPLKFTDPSGEELLTMVAIGIGVGIAAYLLNAIAVEAPITLGGIVQTTFFSIISTTATFGVGSATAGIGNFFLRTGVQAVAHGTVQGGLSEAQGGKFCSGFYSGAISSLASSAFMGGNNNAFDAKGNLTSSTVAWGGAGNFSQSTTGTLLFASISGGLGARLGGGNFWQGAVTGLVVSGFNHVIHDEGSTFKVIDDEGDYIGKIKVREYRLNGKGLRISLGFKSKSSKYSDYNWVQTVHTNDHIDLGYGNHHYNDPTGSAKDDNSPFYYTRDDMKYHTNVDGYSLTFFDSPTRSASPYNIYWRGELSLVGKINNIYQEITTLSYGFNLGNISNINRTIVPLMSVTYNNTYKWLKK